MISIVTPSVRAEGLEVVKKCLNKQTFTDYEWIVVSPFEYKEVVWIPEPEKRPLDHYNLNKAWNLAFKKAKGDLIVSIVDMTWFPADTLERFWTHYQNNPIACVGGVGHQYAEMKDGKPETLYWQDPRIRQDQGTFYEVNPIDLELCCTSLPKKGIFEAGGMDEEWDKYAAISEKELCVRMGVLGYKFYLDQSIEYRALWHPRLTPEWDERYKQGSQYWKQCIDEINSGKRLKLEYLK